MSEKFSAMMYFYGLPLGDQVRFEEIAKEVAQAGYGLGDWKALAAEVWARVLQRAESDKVILAVQELEARLRQIETEAAATEAERLGIIGRDLAHLDPAEFGVVAEALTRVAGAAKRLDAEMETTNSELEQARLGHLPKSKGKKGAGGPGGPKRPIGDKGEVEQAAGKRQKYVVRKSDVWSPRSDTLVVHPIGMPAVIREELAMNGETRWIVFAQAGNGWKLSDLRLEDAAWSTMAREINLKHFHHDNDHPGCIGEWTAGADFDWESLGR